MHKRDLSGGADIIKQFEGLRLKAYKDSGGVWTIGWGSTRGVKAGMVITRAQAETMFQADFMDAMTPVQRSLKVQVNDNEFAALVSFCFNVGAGAYNKSTLLKKLNASAPLTQVADEFMKWNKVKGRVVAGLTRRRSLERALFLKPEPVEVKTT
jgi:GH24 family phage-related lysozyme (muramidase)